MKLVSLNIAAGKWYDPLMKFIDIHSEDTDIFCLQEVFDTPDGRKTLETGHRGNIYRELVEALPEYTAFHSPSEKNRDFQGQTDYEIYWGPAIFFKDGTKVFERGDIFVHQTFNTHTIDFANTQTNLQYLVIEKDKQLYTIANFHGLWNGKGKSDTNERLSQSKRIKSFMDKVQGKKILTGDFNLMPDTVSLAFAGDGLVNLIKNHGITDTRGVNYSKKLRFADYTFVSSDVKVESFEVSNVAVSDHLPMILKFI